MLKVQELGGAPAASMRRYVAKAASGWHALACVAGEAGGTSSVRCGCTGGAVCCKDGVRLARLGLPKVRTTEQIERSRWSRDGRGHTAPSRWASACRTQPPHPTARAHQDIKEVGCIPCTCTSQPSLPTASHPPGSPGDAATCNPPAASPSPSRNRLSPTWQPSRSCHTTRTCTVQTPQGPKPPLAHLAVQQVVPQHHIRLHSSSLRGGRHAGRRSSGGGHESRQPSGLCGPQVCLCSMPACAQKSEKSTISTGTQGASSCTPQHPPASPQTPGLPLPHSALAGRRVGAPPANKHKQ